MALTLGIDLGTSKIAALLFDSNRKSPIAIASKESNSALVSPAGWAEQDTNRILAAVERVIGELPDELRNEVQAIGVTGQMHGVLLFDPRSKRAANLVTWQDQRCDANFLARIKRELPQTSLKSGYGCATLAWLKVNAPERLAAYPCCSTIHDYLVSCLCDLPHPVTDPTDAASFGLFNVKDGHWEKENIEALGIPFDILPRLIAVGGKAGALSIPYAEKWGLPAGIPVAAAIGDNQASLHATVMNPKTDIALTLGTGGQISVIEDSREERTARLEGTYEYRPYVDGAFAAVAASLCGGSAYAWLAETAASWLKDLAGVELPMDEVYAKLTSLGLHSNNEGLTIHPHFLGERFDPSLKGTIGGITCANFSLGNVATALSFGIVENLRRMLPQELLVSRTRVVGSGNAIRRSPLLQKIIQDVFGVPLVISSAKEEAATGAALLALRLIK